MTPHEAPDAASPLGQLLLGLDQAWYSKSWHGSTLRGALSRVTPEMAAWRPGPGRPSIWELTVHCAYWKHIVLRRVAVQPTEPFREAGSDFFPRPDRPEPNGWRSDLDYLGAVHRELRAAVVALDPDLLGTFPGDSTTRLDDLIRGVSYHDVHHGGQVQMLKKLWRLERS